MSRLREDVLCLNKEKIGTTTEEGAPDQDRKEAQVSVECTTGIAALST